MAGSALILASCGSNNNNANNDQAKLDSAMKAGEAAKQAEIQHQNDSTIAAQAKAKADSEIIAKNAVEKDHEKHGTKHEGTAHNTTQAAAPAPAPAPTNPKDSRFNGTPTPAQQQQNTDKKASRF